MVLGLEVCSSSRYIDGDEEEMEMRPQSMIPGIKLFGTKIPAPEGQIPVNPGAGFQASTEPQFKVYFSS